MIPTKEMLKLSCAAVLALFLTACSDDDDDEVSDEDPQTFTLQLLHMADADGGGDVVGNVPRFSAILEKFRNEYPDNTLVLSSGDNYIPGPLYSASDDDSMANLLGVPSAGRGDILLLNAMGVQASAFGNHEFDNGPDEIATLLAAEGDYPGAAFPYLSTNLDFSADADLGPLVGTNGAIASTMPGKIAGYVTVDVDGESIGVVGATTPTLASISSPGSDIVISPADATDLDALAAEIQQAVDALTAAGINKVVLLAHMQQIAIEKVLAEKLSDVDIIVAGGSNTLLADNTDRLRIDDTAADTYPLWKTSATNQPVAIVNTDGDYKYLGRLVVAFDANGVVIDSSVDEAISGAYATDEQGLIENNLSYADANAEVAVLAYALGDVLLTREGNTFGQTTVYLNGIRGSVRTEETNLGNLTADANLWYAQQSDTTVAVSLKNGGGIRAAIGATEVPAGSTDPNDTVYLPPKAIPAAGKEEGQISQFDIQNSLRFNNSLTMLTVTAQELHAIVEHAVAATADGATPGQFPQISGMAFSFDPSLTAGSRVRSLIVHDSNGAEAGETADVIVQDGTLQGDPNRTFRMVTLGFLAGGGDGYPFPATGLVDLEMEGVQSGDATFADDGTEQDALAEYLLMQFPDASPFSAADTPMAEDTRIQNLSARSDTVLP